jgi:hypothetical protein
MPRKKRFKLTLFLTTVMRLFQAFQPHTSFAQSLGADEDPQEARLYIRDRCILSSSEPQPRFLLPLLSPLLVSLVSQGVNVAGKKLSAMAKGEKFEESASARISLIRETNKEARLSSNAGCLILVVGDFQYNADQGILSAAAQLGDIGDQTFAPPASTFAHQIGMTLDSSLECQEKKSDIDCVDGLEAKIGEVLNRNGIPVGRVDIVYEVAMISEALATIRLDNRLLYVNYLMTKRASENGNGKAGFASEIGVKSLADGATTTIKFPFAEEAAEGKWTAEIRRNKAFFVTKRSFGASIEPHRAIQLRYFLRRLSQIDSSFSVKASKAELEDAQAQAQSGPETESHPISEANAAKLQKMVSSRRIPRNYATTQFTVKIVQQADDRPIMKFLSEVLEESQEPFAKAVETIIPWPDTEQERQTKDQEAIKSAMSACDNLAKAGDTAKAMHELALKKAILKMELRGIKKATVFGEGKTCGIVIGNN